MKIGSVAAQLYTIRDHLKTPADIASSLKRVRGIGYRAVQVSGMGAIVEEDLMKILDAEGLVCCATHEPTQRILDEPRAIVERLRKLHCTYTAVPYPSGISLATLDDVKKFAARMNAAGKVLADAGMVLTYHNHHVEFARVEGKLILDIIYDETDPRYLQGEIDTYWVQTGGAEPTAWCRKLKGRLPLLHMKDYALDKDNNRACAEIGSGNLHWDTIVPAAEQSGCTWFIVEQDDAWANGDPFESLKTSFEYIRAKLCG